MRSELHEVDHLFSEVLASHAKYHSLIDSFEERQESSKWMNDNDAIVFEFKSYVNNWINDSTTNGLRQHDVNPANQAYPSNHQQLNTASETGNPTHIIRNSHAQASPPDLSRHSQTFNKEHSRLLPGIPCMDAPEMETMDNQYHQPPVGHHIQPLNSPHYSNRLQHIHAPQNDNSPRHGNNLFSTTRNCASSIGSRGSQLFRNVPSTVIQRSRIRSNSDPGEHQLRSLQQVSGTSSSVSSKLSAYVEQKAKVAALKAEANFLKESQVARGTEWEIAKEIAKAKAIAGDKEGRQPLTKQL